MDNDVKIKLIYASSLTVVYTVLILKAPIDITVIASITSGFVGALSGIFTYNLAKRSSQDKDESENKNG